MEGGRDAKIEELWTKIEDVKRRMPDHHHKLCATKIVHSASPELLMQLEELEEELKKLEGREE